MLPLQGIRVVEIAQNLSGPYCAQILAHLGADVIKVERPEGGDDTRGWGPPFLEGAGTSFHAVNLAKRSIAVDLKDAAAVERLRELIDGADVVVQNLRPGAVEALGLGAPALIGRNRRLVYCSLRALGSAGPLKDRPGFEPMVQAFAGMMLMSGQPDGPPIRIGTQVLDHGTGMWAAIGIYAGREDNTFFRRAEHGLVQHGTKVLNAKDTVPLGATIIHAVTNPLDQITAAIHVYGGDFFNTPRSEWDPQTLEEKPYDVADTMRAFEESNARLLGRG